ncbi:ABC transporter ATP-binding protein/permease [Ancylothrix sp. C2]|uniref:ABC transporter ATP-binding protein n=1 Tax=Ancylothrix sp. D3o TaxID=2953691 RepID=UPI0021BB75A2|nr:ABC transporter ATP-binding protein [Ancylothrix sp. D3o]MCT7949525.1 ABC transporter ATP-binding protein/permease [Ancylothrix sp. D3o]
MKNQLQLLQNLKRAIRLVWQSTHLWTTASLILLLIQGLLPLLSLYLMKLIVDTVTAGIGGGTAAFYQVLLFVFLAGITALLSDLCRSLSGYASEAQSQIVTDFVHDLLHAKSIELDLEYYENSQFYNALHRAQQEAIYRPNRILTSLVQLAQNAISLIAIAGLLVSLHWGIAAVLFVAALPSLFVRFKHTGKLYKKQRSWTMPERIAYYFHLMLTNHSYAKEVRLFDLGSLFRRRYQNLRTQIRQEKLTLSQQRNLAELMSQASSTLAVYAACGFIAYQTIQGQITLGGLVMYYQGFQRGQTFLREMLNSLASLYENSLFLSLLYEFLDLKRAVVEPLSPQTVPKPIQNQIQLESVSFHYPHSNRALLEDINLTIKAGETVALVGENGAGKTTLIKLLCRLYDPTSGSITIDGIDLKQLNTTDWRREISVVFQDYARYNLTAQENIGFGNINLLQETADIVKAAQESGADRVISRLPKGYDTTLGTQFDEGEELSIGEWQKVAIARAFLRQAQILILDEPTSALDAKAEYEVFEQFRQLIKGKTAILISHRLSTVKMVDRIFVLQNGKIVETGTHEELLKLGGTYAQLFEIQAKYYQ